MTRYLLDTTVIADLVRNPQGPITQHIRRVGETQVCTSIIVAAELRYGVAKRGSARLAKQLGAVLGALDVLPFETPADRAYGEIRARPRKGRQINRRQRPAHCRPSLCACYTLVTDKTAEFARVQGLLHQKWLR